MQIELRELSMYDGYDILEMIREIGPGENGFSNGAYNISEADFRSFLINKIFVSKGIDLKADLVPQTTYWLYADGVPVGYGRLREYLNDSLRIKGGHIGYCIRPSARGKGFGNAILGELLNSAKEKNIPRALLTCLENKMKGCRLYGMKF